MSEEMPAVLQEPEKKRRFPLKLVLIAAALIAFAVGMAIEVYKHSDSRMKSLLENNKQSFEACAEFFGIGGGSESVTVTDKEIEAETINADSDKKRAVFTSAQFLAEKYKEQPVGSDIAKLSDAGVQKISLEGWEVRFYTDVDSGICYISEKAKSSPGFYYPEGYLDDNRVEGDWYRFGRDVKKK
ncbi:MAG: hypothetical protein IKO27_06370 [Ruminococcus sp.]|nr:hypothetical protein [Ruminococcus sp.]